MTSTLKNFLGEYLDVSYALSETHKHLDPQDSIIVDILEKESKIDQRREFLVEEKNRVFNIIKWLITLKVGLVYYLVPQ